MQHMWPPPAVPCSGATASGTASLVLVQSITVCTHVNSLLPLISTRTPEGQVSAIIQKNGI